MQSKNLFIHHTGCIFKCTQIRSSDIKSLLHQTYIQDRSTVIDLKHHWEVEEQSLSFQPPGDWEL